jgi:hypothetical protein
MKVPVLFEDEMTEDNLAKTDAEYLSVTRQEIHAERIAVMQAFARSLEGLAAFHPHPERDMEAGR